MTVFAFFAALLLSLMILYFEMQKDIAPVRVGQSEKEITMNISHKKIDMYVTQTCPYCVRAKKLLDQKGALYTVIDVSNDADLREKMIVRANGKRTVPQIFIGDYHVGGCDDLYALDSLGKLDTLLDVSAGE